MTQKPKVISDKKALELLKEKPNGKIIKEIKHGSFRHPRIEQKPKGNGQEIDDRITAKIMKDKLAHRFIMQFITCEKKFVSGKLKCEGCEEDMYALVDYIVAFTLKELYASWEKKHPDDWIINGRTAKELIKKKKISKTDKKIVKEIVYGD